MTVKIILFFSICAVGTFALDFHPLYIECAKELKIEIDLSETSAELDKRVSEPKGYHEINCIVACMFRKDDKNGKSLYDSLMRTVNDEAKPKRRMQMLEKLNKCNETDGHDDCKLMACYDLNKPPVFDHFIQAP